MRIARVSLGGRSSTAIVKGRRVHLVSGTIWKPGDETGESAPLSAVRFLPPTKPTKIVAIGVNYLDHAGERRAPSEAQPFLKAPSSLIGPGEAIELTADATNTHMEAEVVAVISKRARDITEDQVDDYNGTLVQKAFPNLTADEREFFMTGVTAKEWEDVFGKDE